MLNSQSDAIVVADTGKSDSGMLNFLFGNSMSIKLFGFNFMQPDSKSEEDHPLYDLDMLNLPRFVPLDRLASTHSQ